MRATTIEGQNALAPDGQKTREQIVIELPNGRDQSASMHSGPSILSGSPNEC